MRDDFCAFILTHGRPDRVYTIQALQESGYTGKIFIIIDDEDSSGDDYRDRFGDMVLTFCKRDVAAFVDGGDNFENRGVVYARNVCWMIADQVGCRYFIQLDDDYTLFTIRFNGYGEYIGNIPIKNMDKKISAMLEFYESTHIHTIAMAQSGEFIGGFGIDESGKQIGGGVCRLRRKAMNSFICSIDRPFKFFGRINEDVNAYVEQGRKGMLFFTAMQIQLTQKATQKNEGGLTELYLDVGTYVKSFYSVMYSPSCVKIGILGDHRSPHYRIHHQINWHKTAPKILQEEWKR